MLRKSTEAEISGIVEEVKASISRGRPGTAADMSLFGPKASRISERREG